MKTNVAVVANAIRQNGYEQAFGSFKNVDPKTGKISACALGQAGLNLKVEGGNLCHALNRFVDGDGTGLGDTIVEWNDENHWTLDQIAERIERDWTHVLYETVVV